MPDKEISSADSLTPTAKEAEQIRKMKLPRFANRDNVLVVADAETGERQFVLRQDLPAYLRRANVKRYSVGSAIRPVQRHEWRDVNRRAKTLHNRIRVEAGTTIELPGGNGERIFIKITRPGWFHARAFEIAGRRRIVIDNGPGAALWVNDTELYEGFKEVPGG